MQSDKKMSWKSTTFFNNYQKNFFREPIPVRMRYSDIKKEVDKCISSALLRIGHGPNRYQDLYYLFLSLLLLDGMVEFYLNPSFFNSV